MKNSSNKAVGLKNFSRKSSGVIWLEDTKMDPREILSKVKMGGKDESWGITWAEEVEREIPSTGGVGSWFKKKRPARRVNFKKDITYPNEVRIGIHLAMQQGKAVEEADKLETEYIDRLSRKPGVCKNSGSEDTFSSVRKPTRLNSFLNMEAMGEEAVREVINRWEDRPKINSRLDPVSGKMQHFFVLLAMSPRQVSFSF